jgi:hypothetical protein
MPLMKVESKMKSASHMSSLIRAKKKKMQEDPDVIDISGSPKEDLQDLDIERQNETAEQNDENTPKERSEGLDLSNASEDKMEEVEQKNHKDENANHMDNEKELLRHARLRKSMRK